MPKLFGGRKNKDGKPLFSGPAGTMASGIIGGKFPDPSTLASPNSPYYKKKKSSTILSPDPEGL